MTLVRGRGVELLHSRVTALCGSVVLSPFFPFTSVLDSRGDVAGSPNRESPLCLGLSKIFDRVERENLYPLNVKVLRPLRSFSNCIGPLSCRRPFWKSVQERPYQVSSVLFLVFINL